MKKWKQGIIGLLAVIVLGVGITSCDDHIDCDCQEVPIPKTKIVHAPTNTGIATVFINYTALANTVPSYMATLEIVIKNVLSTSTTTGNLTINIVPSGEDGFIKNGLKTVDVRESWIAGATEMEMGISLDTKRSDWVTP